MQLRYPAQGAVEESDNFYGRSISRCAWNSFGPGTFTLAHLVHPGTAIMLAASKNETILPVDANLDIEALIFHLRIEFRPSVRFTEREACCMPLQGFMNYLLYCTLLRVGPRVVHGEPGIIIWKESPLDLVLEERSTIWYDSCVVLYALQEEPNGIS